MVTGEEKEGPYTASDAMKAAKSIANSILKDRKETLNIVYSAWKKAEQNSSALKKVRKDLDDLLRLLKVWGKGEYEKAPWRTILLALAGIIYFLNPFDVVPDFIPLTGFLDDISVLGFVVAGIRKDLDAFLVWERGKVLKEGAFDPERDLSPSSV